MRDDRKEWDRILQGLNLLKGKKLIICIDENKTYENGVKVETVAMWLEYGKDEFEVHYPARPFFRTTFDINVDKINRVFVNQVGQLLEGRVTAEQVLHNVGKYVVNKVKDMIINGQYESLAPSTIRRKGSDKPLVDTRTLYDSVIYKVE